MRKLVAALVIVALVASCSHVRDVDLTTPEGDIEETNRAVRGRTVIVQLVDLTEFRAREVVVAADSTSMLLLVPARRCTLLSTS